jgi:hypothetical protein
MARPGRWSADVASVGDIRSVATVILYDRYNGWPIRNSKLAFSDPKSVPGCIACKPNELPASTYCSRTPDAFQEQSNS